MDYTVDFALKFNY